MCQGCSHVTVALPRVYVNLCLCRTCMQKRTLGLRVRQVTHEYVKYPYGYVKCLSIFCSVFYFISHYVFCGRGNVQEISWLSGESIQGKFWHKCARWGGVTAFQSTKVVQCCTRNKLRLLSSYPQPLVLQNTANC